MMNIQLSEVHCYLTVSQSKPQSLTQKYYTLHILYNLVEFTLVCKIKVNAHFYGTIMGLYYIYIYTYIYMHICIYMHTYCTHTSVQG